MAAKDPSSPKLDSSSKNGTANRHGERRPPRNRDESTPPNLNSRPSQRYPQSNRRQQRPKLNNLHQRPNFSLAGSSYAPLVQNNASYVAPGYHEFNPHYNVPSNKPVWGLAKPLPRVVRPGMRWEEEKDDQTGNAKKQDKAKTVVETQDPGGSAEAIPQVEKIPDQRRESNLDPEVPSLRSRISDLMHRDKSTRSNQTSQVATPNTEIEDPMNKWTSSSPELEKENARPAQNNREAARQIYSKADIPQVPSRSECNSRDYSLDIPENADNDVLDGNLDAKLQWAADNDELDEYEAEEAERNFNQWSSTRRRLREPLAECLGSMVAMLIGISANLSVLTSSDTAGTYQSTNWAWGLAITLGIYIAGGVSGGHLNPAISLLLSLYRGFPFPKACIYMLAQLTGTFLAALIAFAVYRPAIIHFSPTSSLIPSETGSAFYLVPTTWSGGGVGLGTGFLTEFVATAILAIAILALGDDSNAPPGAGMHALIVGLIVTVLTMAFGYTDGCGLNPARDLGPRLATAAVGYGTDVFKGDSGWWVWGVWGGEIGGALFGGFLYDAAIFVGGESPINFPRRRWWRRVRRKVGGWAVRELEEARE